jgi:hypothetical protein
MKAAAMRFSFFISFTIAPILLLAQESFSGDSSAAAGILKNLSAQYSTQDSTVHYLTKSQLLKNPVPGAEVSVDYKKGTVTRIVVSSVTDEGMFSEEYIFLDRRLQLVYQTFEYFIEIKSDSRFVNFKGLRGWESRYFFVDERLVFRKTSSLKQAAWTYNENEIMEEHVRLNKFILERTKF